MTENYKKKLIKKLTETILYITVTDGKYLYDRPYTLIPELTDAPVSIIDSLTVSLSDDKNSNVVTCWDLIAGKFVELEREYILGFTMVGNTDNVDEYNSKNISIIESNKLEIKELEAVIDDDVNKLYFREDINRDELRIMKVFGIKKLSLLRNNTKTALTKIKKVWKKSLLERKKEVLDLLDDEIQAAEKAKDDNMVKDLKAIGDTFTGIDGTIDKDLETLSTVKDIFNYWPNLLLPPPEKLLAYKSIYVGKYSN